MEQTLIAAAVVELPNTDAMQKSNVNEVRLSGRLVEDPAVRTAFVGRAVVDLIVAINRGYRDKTGKWHKQVAFVPVTVWHATSDYPVHGIRKGSAIYVEGRLLTSTWKSLDGKRHSTLKVQATRVRALQKDADVNRVAA